MKLWIAALPWWVIQMVVVSGSKDVRRPQDKNFLYEPDRPDTYVAESDLLINEKTTTTSFVNGATPVKAGDTMKHMHTKNQYGEEERMLSKHSAIYYRDGSISGHRGGRYHNIFVREQGIENHWGHRSSSKYKKKKAVRHGIRKHRYNSKPKHRQRRNGNRRHYIRGRGKKNRSRNNYRGKRRHGKRGRRGHRGNRYHGKRRRGSRYQNGWHWNRGSKGSGRRKGKGGHRFRGKKNRRHGKKGRRGNIYRGKRKSYYYRGKGRSYHHHGGKRRRYRRRKGKGHYNGKEFFGPPQETNTPPPTAAPTPTQVTPTDPPTAPPTPTQVIPTDPPSPSQVTSTDPPTAPPTPIEQSPPLGRMKQGNTFPATGGQTTNMLSQGGVDPSDVVCGAVQAVLAHPTAANVCFAGAVNGGVWRTESCDAAGPDWTPLTDSEESLSVGDMVFDDDDSSGNTILVAIGTRSSFNRRGGPGIGMLYTQNALDVAPTWEILDNSAGEVNFRTNALKFRSAFVRGDLMLAAAYDSEPLTCEALGIFRSADGGITWTNVLKGVGLAIASDPNDLMRFYATLDLTALCSENELPPNGVYRSDDGGETWAFTSLLQGSEPILPFELNNAKLSVSADGSRVWSALLRDGVADSISYSDDFGENWVKMDDVLLPNVGSITDGLNPRVKPGSQGEIHFAFFANPSNRDEVYVGGDRQNSLQNPEGPFWPNYVGATDATGILFRGDASVVSNGGIPSPQWEHMTNSDMIETIPGGGTASNSGPHADTRDMEFRADGAILEGDDGGVTVRTDPSSNEGDWFGVCGNMQVFETHSVAYEPEFGFVLFGNQDTGTIVGELGIPGSFQTIFKADGNHCMIDNTSSEDTLYLYYGNQYFRFFLRAELNKVTGAGAAVDIKANLGPFPGDFVSIAAMNPADRKIFAVATSLGEVPPETLPLPTNQISLTRDRGDSFVNYETPFEDHITAMVWSTTDNILYVASGSQVTSCVLSETNLDCGTEPMGVVAPPIVGDDTFVRHMAVNPDDSLVLYAAKTTDGFASLEVFVSDDGGSTWTDITVPGSLLDQAARGGSVAYIRQNSVSTVVVGTSNGILILNDSMEWIVLASLPKVPVLDMVYEPLDDMLVVATLGRGVWFLEEASQVIVGKSMNSQLASSAHLTPMRTDNWHHGDRASSFEFDSLISDKTVPVSPDDAMYGIPEDNAMIQK